MNTLRLALLLTVLGIQEAPTGSISGQVVDAERHPVAAAAVDALKLVERNGMTELISVERVQTNERGEYRLFWLDPGSYYVCAIDADGPVILTDWSVRTSPSTNSELAALSTFWGWPLGDRLSSPVYFPSSPDIRTATRVALTGHEDFANADIRMLKPAAHKISGVVEGLLD